MRTLRKISRSAWIAAAATLASAAAVVSAGPVKTADIWVADVNGAPVRPLAGTGRKATVFFYITTDCPIANSYAPEIERICRDYKPKHIAFYVVYVDPGMSAAVDKKHAADYGFRCPALIDSTHTLVRLTGASVTPEAAVVAPDGKLLYRGRIDDRFVDFGKARTIPTTHDLRDALDAIVRGAPVLHTTTRAVGCFIPGLPAKHNE